MTPASNGRARVVLVSDSEEYAGAEHILVTVAEGLRDRFNLSAVVGDRAASETVSQLERAGAEVSVVEGLRRHPSPAGLVRLLVALRGLSPDLVHINCADQGGGLAPVVAARALRASTVATLHLVSPRRWSWLDDVSGLALRRADAVIAVSESVADYLESQGVQGTVVHNGVSVPDQTPNAREVLRLPATGFVVGGLGRLHRQKGWDVLCRAARVVVREIPGSNFVVLGDGPERESLTDDAACGAVRFDGYRDDASALLSAFDVLAIPSRWEGFGRVAVEAMLAGVPVVAARSGGLPEVIGDSGVLVPPEDPAALADGIVRLAESEELRAELGRRGRERAQRRFGIRQMVEGTLRVYESTGLKPMRKGPKREPTKEA